MHRKPKERAQARELREAGVPYKRIATQLGISPSSAYAWTQDIELTEEQKAANLRGPRGPHTPERIRQRAEAWAARCRSRRKAMQEEGRAAARAGHALHLVEALGLDLPRFTSPSTSTQTTAWRSKRSSGTGSICSSFQTVQLEATCSITPPRRAADGHGTSSPTASRALASTRQQWFSTSTGPFRNTRVRRAGLARLLVLTGRRHN